MLCSTSMTYRHPRTVLEKVMSYVMLPKQSTVRRTFSPKPCVLRSRASISVLASAVTPVPLERTVIERERNALFSLV